MIPSSRHFSLAALACAKRLRRTVALLACLGVLGWTLSTATHWHDEGTGSRSHGTAGCALCVALPTGATPPAPFTLQLLPPPVSAAIEEPAPRALVAAPRSSYQSRAPPAG